MSEYISASGADRTRWGRRASWVAYGLGGAITLLTGAWIGAQFWPYWSEANQQAATQPQPLPAVVPAGDVAAAVRQPQAESTLGLGGTDSSVAESASTLVLRATHPGKEGEPGSAEIGTDPNNPQVFIQGAILANGARLAEIHDNRVVIERRGSQATLYVTGPQFKPSGTQGDPAATASLTEEQRQKLVSGDRSLASVGGEPPPATLLQPAAGRSGFIRVEQMVVDGLVQGYRVSPGADSGRFSQAGFRAGDIVTAMDGVPVDSQTRVNDLIASISRGDLRTVTVMRGEVATTLSLEGAPGPVPPAMPMPN